MRYAARVQDTQQRVAMEGRPVVCLSHYRVCLAVGTVGGAACARTGMLVVRHPDFVGEASGRVADGVGWVIDPDFGLGNIAVYWDDSGDRTLWTRAADHGTDVVVATRPAN